MTVASGGFGLVGSVRVGAESVTDRMTDDLIFASKNMWFLGFSFFSFFIFYNKLNLFFLFQGRMSRLTPEQILRDVYRVLRLHDFVKCCYFIIFIFI